MHPSFNFYISIFLVVINCSISFSFLHSSIHRLISHTSLDQSSKMLKQISRLPSIGLHRYCSTTSLATKIRLPSTSRLNGFANFYNVPKEDFVEVLKEWGQPSFRADQIRKWILDKGVTEFIEMKDIPMELRQKLTEYYTIGNLKLVSEQVSKDGTKKRAYELHDGQLIESVLMPYNDGRMTACISSQAGCGMG